jgi:hypothetical protein
VPLQAYRLVQAYRLLLLLLLLLLQVYHCQQ